MTELCLNSLTFFTVDGSLGVRVLCYISLAIARLPVAPIARVGGRGRGWAGRLEICKKIYTTGFFSQKFDTLKVCKLRQFLLKKNSVNALISVILVFFFVRI